MEKSTTNRDLRTILESQGHSFAPRVTPSHWSMAMRETGPESIQEPSNVMFALPSGTRHGAS